MDANTPSAAAAPAVSQGGIKAWLPLLATLVAMPVVAWGTMRYLIAPGTPAPAATATTDQGHGPATTANAPAIAPPVQTRGANSQTFRLEKVVANVKDTKGARYIMSTFVLKGASPKFEATLTENRDQLLDITLGILRGKTIEDLERPEALTQLKIELMSVFNTALGQSLVKDIFIPEWVIQ